MYRIAEYISEFQATNGYSPGQRGIADHFRITLPRAHRLVKALEGQGRIERNDDGTIATPYKLIPSDLNHVPLVGAVKCGKPTLAIEEFDGVFKLPKEFTGSGDFFMLRAEGDSMIDRGIEEGDYLVISEQPAAYNGDIVVACRESDYGIEEADATLKTYKKINGRYVLHAENKDGGYEDMDASEFRIIGKLVSLIRKF
ncbi:MAG: transcriptional repressor LexA [Firmicutes bacterium]|nr:transcriptional repressor LexA [Bacillota bacterium]